MPYFLMTILVMVRSTVTYAQTPFDADINRLILSLGKDKQSDANDEKNSLGHL